MLQHDHSGTSGCWPHRAPHTATCPAMLPALPKGAPATTNPARATGGHTARRTRPCCPWRSQALRRPGRPSTPTQRATYARAGRARTKAQRKHQPQHAPQEAPYAHVGSPCRSPTHGGTSRHSAQHAPQGATYGHVDGRAAKARPKGHQPPRAHRAPRSGAHAAALPLAHPSPTQAGPPQHAPCAAPYGRAAWAPPKRHQPSRPQHAPQEAPYGHVDGRAA